MYPVPSGKARADGAYAYILMFKHTVQYIHLAPSKGHVQLYLVHQAPSNRHVLCMYQKLYSLDHSMVTVYVDKSEICKKYIFMSNFLLGSSDFDKIFENCYALCSFGFSKEIYMQDCFRKGIFLFL